MEDQVGKNMGGVTMHKAHEETALYRCGQYRNQAALVLDRVYAALEERGYDPVAQLVGYLMSGDPTYITSHREARDLIRTVERDELLAELIRSYVRNRASEARTG
jgi:uncharacterized protein (UPF0297 family)